MKLQKLPAILLIAFATVMVSSCGVSRRVTTMQVGSYNIRYENRGDSLRGNGWGQRCPIITQQILFHDLEIFGTQEGKFNQLEQMKALLPHKLHPLQKGVAAAACPPGDHNSG